MLFYNTLSFLLIQKSLTPRNFSPQKPSKFKTHFHDFYNTKKANLPIFLIINLKGYEILVVKFIREFTD
ncbi:hypothetical protein VB002_07400 [Campylobacter concisus]